MNCVCVCVCMIHVDSSNRHLEVLLTQSQLADSESEVALLWEDGGWRRLCLMTVVTNWTSCGASCKHEGARWVMEAGKSVAVHPSYTSSSSLLWTSVTPTSCTQTVCVIDPLVSLCVCSSSRSWLREAASVRCSRLDLASEEGNTSARKRIRSALTSRSEPGTYWTLLFVRKGI